MNFNRGATLERLKGVKIIWACFRKKKNCETSQWNTVIKQNKGPNGDLKPEHKKITNMPNHLKAIEEGAAI